MIYSLLLLNLIILFNLVVGNKKNYPYGNIISIQDKNNLSIEKINEIIYDITNTIKTFDSLKHNLTDIQVFDVSSGYILNQDFHTDIKFVEDIIVEKKLINSNRDVYHFDYVFEKVELIQKIAKEIYKDETEININKYCLNKYFDYELWEKILKQNEYETIKTIILAIYSVKSDLDFILTKIKWYENEINKYNPEIYNNYITSMTELYKEKSSIKQIQNL